MRINTGTNARGSAYSELTVNLGFITIPSLREDSEVSPVFSCVSGIKGGLCRRRGEEAAEEVSVTGQLRAEMCRTQSLPQGLLELPGQGISKGWSSCSHGMRVWTKEGMTLTAGEVEGLRVTETQGYLLPPLGQKAGQQPHHALPYPRMSSQLTG